MRLVTDGNTDVILGGWGWWLMATPTLFWVDEVGDWRQHRRYYGWTMYGMTYCNVMSSFTPILGQSFGFTLVYSCCHHKPHSTSSQISEMSFVRQCTVISILSKLWKRMFVDITSKQMSIKYILFETLTLFVRRRTMHSDIVRLTADHAPWHCSLNGGPCTLSLFVWRRTMHPDIVRLPADQAPWHCSFDDGPCIVRY